MITRIEVSGVHMEVDKKLKRYVIKKIGPMDRYIPRSARQSAHAEVFLKGEKKGGEKYTAEITMYLPAEALCVKESSLNIYAAFDIVETKLKNRLIKYKDTHASTRLYRRLARKFRQKLQTS